MTVLDLNAAGFITDSTYGTYHRHGCGLSVSTDGEWWVWQFKRNGYTRPEMILEPFQPRTFAELETLIDRCHEYRTTVHDDAATE